MAYTSESARAALLDDLSEAVDQLATALASLGEAYEEVDEHTAEVLEERLFRPVQGAYGRGRRTYTEFAQRYGLSARSFEQGSRGAYSADPRVHVERAVAAIERADQVVAEMQDSMLPVEVGDRELRDGLTAIRELIAAPPAYGRQLLRTIGR
jgi:hypothetical protein